MFFYYSEFSNYFYFYKTLTSLNKLKIMSEVSSTNKTDHHDITEILLKMALNTIVLILTTNYFYKTLRAFKKWKIMSKFAHDKRKG